MNFYQLGYAIAAVLSQPPTFSPVEFSSKSRKQCKSGYGCGWTCISTKKKCRVAVTGEAKNFAQYVRQHKGKLTAIQQQKAKAQNIGLQSKATIKRAKTTLTKSTTKPKVISPDIDINTFSDKQKAFISSRQSRIDRARAAGDEVTAAKIEAIMKETINSWKKTSSNTTVPGQRVPVSVRDTIIDQKRWDSLPDENKKKIEELQKEFNSLGYIDVRTQLGPDQTRRMTDKQKQNLQKTTLRAFEIESEIKRLSLTPDEIKRLDNYRVKAEAQTKVDQLTRHISDFESLYLKQLASPRNNKLKQQLESMKSELAETESIIKKTSSTSSKPQPINQETNQKVEDFHPDTSKVPIQKAENAYRHIYSTGAGKFEQEQYSKYLNGIKDEALKGIPFAQKPQLLKELNKVSDEWVANRESVYAAASQSYSSFVAGASGFNQTQAQNRGSGYTKALSDFDDWANKRKQEIFDQTGVTKVKDSRKKLRDLMLEIDSLKTVHGAKIASPRPNKQKLRYGQAQAERDSLKHEIKMLVDPDYAAKNLNP